MRFEKGDGCLHRLSRLQYEGELHLARGEQLADDLHAFEEHVIHDLERRVGRQGEIKFGLETVAVAVDNPLRQSLFDGPVGAVLGDLGFALERPRTSRSRPAAGHSRHAVGRRSGRDRSRASSSILLSGKMRAAWTMAASSPAATHSWRYTEFKATRAAGESPNETLERPSTV